jgi:hypothetical protein
MAMTGRRKQGRPKAEIARLDARSCSQWPHPIRIRCPSFAPRMLSRSHDASPVRTRSRERRACTTGKEPAGLQAVVHGRVGAVDGTFVRLAYLRMPRLDRRNGRDFSTFRQPYFFFRLPKPTLRARPRRCSA